MNLQAFVQNPLVRQEKDGTPGWSPAVYPSGKTRAKENVEFVTAATADFDGGVTIDVIETRLRDLGVEFALHTTFSHEDGSDRFRVILPLAEPVAAADWPGAFAELHALAPELDRVCSDASRFFFAPCRRPDAPYEWRYVPGKRLQLRGGPAPDQHRSTAVGETIPIEHLQVLLGQLVEHGALSDMNGREPWIQLMMECHASSGGSPDGFDAFIALGEEFLSRSDIDNWEYQWEHLDPEKAGGRTVASLIRRVVQAGGNPTAPADFPDDLPEPPAPLAGRKPQSLAPFDRELTPLRPWLVDNMLLDGTMTLLVAKGGAGKSLFVLHLAAMVGLGIPWAHWRAAKPGKVLVLNAEDDRDELLRRIAVITDAMGIPISALDGRIDAYARGELPDFVLVRRSGQHAEAQRTPLFVRLKELIAEQQYGLVVIDPLIKVHSGLDENSNDDMELVARTLGELAENPAVSVLAVHHASKGGAGRGQDASRGGGSIVAAARALLNLEPMDEKEAEHLLPADERRRFRSYVKVTGDKQNYSESSGVSWLQFQGGYVDNGPGGGDRAAAFVPWSPHVPLDATPEQVDKVLDEIMRRSRLGGERYYRPEFRGTKETRGDVMVADLLGVTELQARGLLQQLMEQERVVEQVYDVKGRSTKRLVVGDEDGVRLAPTQAEVEEDEE